MPRSHTANVAALYALILLCGSTMVMATPNRSYLRTGSPELETPAPAPAKSRKHHSRSKHVGIAPHDASHPQQTHATPLEWRMKQLASSAAGTSAASVVDVMSYGAVPDGKTDNTKAFQAALNAVNNGGIVFVPTGQFLFTGSLVFPEAVTMEGVYRSVPSHSHILPTDGSVLLVTGNRNNESADPFMTLNGDCTLRGVTLFYPDQAPDQVPAPYPYAIRLVGNNPAVIDVELLNPFNGIYAVGAARHFIARVQGQPANIGIYVDQTYDIGRIQNVHWNPWYSDNPTYMSWQLVHGVGYVFARTDWEYVLNTFVFGMSVGYHFIESPQGSCNGNFLGIGADMAVNASVLVDAADPWGIMITNGEFTSFVTAQWGPESHVSTQVVVSPTNAGAVRFVNSAFWGPSYQIAQLNGTGTIGFSDCTFSQWDAHNENRPAIHATAGRLIVRGCEFQQDHSPQIELEAAVSKAVITGNIVAGQEQIAANGCPNVQKGFNAFG